MRASLTTLLASQYRLSCCAVKRDRTAYAPMETFWLVSGFASRQALAAFSLDRRKSVGQKPGIHNALVLEREPADVGVAPGGLRMSIPDAARCRVPSVVQTGVGAQRSSVAAHDQRRLRIAHTKARIYVHRRRLAFISVHTYVGHLRRDLCDDRNVYWP